ncbi:MAG TPA: hypothetical protein VFD58_35575 [Blastocatellia bacterium]|nr:hypothetical protein [Blastocatellia bacterium]
MAADFTTFLTGLAADFRDADAFLPDAVLLPADLNRVGDAAADLRDFCGLRFDAALALERDDPAAVLVFVFLIFGMLCDPWGLARVFLAVILCKDTSVAGALLPVSC